MTKPRLRLAVLIERLEHHQPAEAVADEVGLPKALRKARQPLRMRRQRPLAPAIPEEMTAETRGMQPRRERRHHDCRHPQAVHQNDFAHCVQDAARPGSAKIPLMRRMRFSPTHR